MEKQIFETKKLPEYFKKIRAGNPHLPSSEMYILSGDIGDIVEFYYYESFDQWDVIIDNFPGQRIFYKTTFPIRSVEAFMSQMKQVGIILELIDQSKSNDVIEDSLPIKYKGVWTPDYMAERIVQSLNDGVFTMNISKALKSWAADIVEENYHVPISKNILDEQNAWPLIDVLKKLVEVADILLHKKDYDGHGWEEMEHCYNRGKEIISKLEAPGTYEQYKFELLKFMEFLRRRCTGISEDSKSFMFVHTKLPDQDLIDEFKTNPEWLNK